MDQWTGFKEIMNHEKFKDLIIYTGVYYQDNAIYNTRSKIWFKTFDNAQKLGIKVVVRNDGGLPPEMLARIKSYENITIVEKTGPNTMGGGRREALEKAIEIAEKEGVERPVFLWTEPEKDNLITEKNLLQMISGIREGANIVIPERGERAWGQLPKLQRWLEQRAEKRAKKIVEFDGTLDLWFGPQVLDKTGAKYFLGYNSKKNRTDLWDALIVPVLDAKRAGGIVKSVSIDFLYNQNQIENEVDESNREIKIKRIEQYTQILKELGDPKWEDFFRDAESELAEMKRVNAEKPAGKDAQLAESRKSLVKKFFKLH